MSDSTTTGGQEQRSPDELRAEIEQAREELGETAAALVQKADVKARADAKVQEVKGQARARADEAREQVRSSAPDSAAQAATQARDAARRRPLPVAVGTAFIAGLVVGRLSSRS